MKVENFQLRMQSKYTHEKSVLNSYESELKNIDLQKEEAMEYEKQMLAKINLLLVQEFLQLLNSNSENSNSSTNSSNDLQFTGSQKPSTVTQFSHEVQKFEISMKGIIETNNEKVSVNLNISMTHEIFQSKEIDKSSFIDPLVISLDNTLPELSNKTFNFDIDNDGTVDQLSSLKRGNAFLALDRNNDGKIGAGNELFGASSGNGFKELSLFDSDNNFWIDERDPILNKLRIWINNDGKNELLALGEVGIGAIYLGNISSEFQYKSENYDLGNLQSSGLYLREDGQAGLISQIDLAEQELAKSPLVSLLNS